MSDRLSFNSQIECDDIFTPEFQTLLVNLHDKFNDEVKQIRKSKSWVQWVQSLGSHWVGSLGSVGEFTG